MAPCALAAREGGFRPLRDQPPLFLGEGSVQMEHERIGVSAQFGHNERHPLRHEAGHERHISG